MLRILSRFKVAGCFILYTVHPSSEAIGALLHDQSATLFSAKSLKTDRLIARASEARQLLPSSSDPIMALLAICSLLSTSARAEFRQTAK